MVVPGPVKPPSIFLFRGGRSKSASIAFPAAAIAGGATGSLRILIKTWNAHEAGSPISEGLAQLSIGARRLE